jgi:DNA topoisomerase VI subunit A
VRSSTCARRTRAAWSGRSCSWTTATGWTARASARARDVSRAKELLRYRWFEKKPWQEEIKRMLSIGLKYELDALANKDFRYLTKTYLPRKLKERDWLD